MLIVGGFIGEETIKLKILSGAYWDQGKRVVNQDSIMLQQVMTSYGRVLLVAVSDGIGGLEEGEIASGYITERLIENFYAQIIPLTVRRKGKSALKKSMLRCLYDISDKLKLYGKSKGIQLGATLSLLLIWGKNYMIVHLGDSRIYLYQDKWWCKKKFRLLTEDHSDGRRGLTRCIGSFPFQYPDIRFGRIWGRNGFLVCTDGFYRALEEEMLRILSVREIENEEQIYRRLKEMAAASLKKGESDNLSAVYSVIY